MKALCTEAALRALRRTYPQVYQENARLKIDKSKIFVTEVDIDDALATIQCSSRRSRPSFGLTLPPAAEPILRHTLAATAKHISTFFPAATPAYKRLSAQCAGESNLSGETSSGASSIEADSSTVASFHGMDVVYRPKVLLYGVCGNAHGLIARALIQALDPVPCYSLDMHSLHMQTGSGGKALLEEAVVSTIAEARSRSPSIIFLPDFHTWWSSASDSLKMCLETSIKSLPPALQVLLLATADLSHETANLSEVLRSRHILSVHHGVAIAGPTEADRGDLFAGLPKDVRTWTEHPAAAAAFPALERDTVEAPWTKEYMDPQQKQREEKALRGMRMNLRKLCLKLLANKRYKDFHLPVLDSINEELRDSYRKCIANPMDLATALVQIDNRVIRCKSEFMSRVELIVQNAMTFNGTEGPENVELAQAEAVTEEKATKTYVIPVFQEKRIQTGSILEIHLEDDITKELEWHTCKVTQVDCDKMEFVAHVLIENKREMGGWYDTYPMSAEGKDWRWPSEQAVNASQEHSRRLDMASIQRVNETICSLAHELQDECEDLFEKLDSWLVGQCERIVSKLCPVDPNNTTRGYTSSAIAMPNGVPFPSSRSELWKGVQIPLTRVPVHCWGSDANKNVRKDGVVLQTKEGLMVACNEKMYSLQQFERNAGNASRRPRDSIVISDTGESLNRATNGGRYKLARPPNERLSMCLKCGKDDNPKMVILCNNFEKCGGVLHAGCASPPLKEVPEGDWFCPSCPIQTHSPQMYVVPDINSSEQELREGVVIEISMASEVEQSQREGCSEWITAKVLNINEPPDSFNVHAVSNWAGESLEWSREVQSAEEGTAWRWPERQNVHVDGAGLNGKRPASAVDGMNGISGFEVRSPLGMHSKAISAVQSPRHLDYRSRRGTVLTTFEPSDGQ